MGTEAAITLLFGLLDRAALWAKEISAAKAEGREVNVDLFVTQDEAEKAALEAAIAKRKAEGG